MSRDSNQRFASFNQRESSEHKPEGEAVADFVRANRSRSGSGSAKLRTVKFDVAPTEPKSPRKGRRGRDDVVDKRVPVSHSTGVVKTVCVVEACTAIRQLTVNYINQLGGFKVIAASANFDEGVKACTTLKPDVAIVDGCMSSETHGTSLTRAVQASSPATKVLVFCPAAHPDLIREAVDANVAGFVLRTDPAATIEAALRDVAAGKRYQSRQVAALVRERRQVKTEPSVILSPRERQVLKEIARGRLSKEIATSLGMSVFGVQNVRRRITRKTGLKSVAQLTLYAAKLLLVPGPEQP